MTNQAIFVLILSIFYIQCNGTGDTNEVDERCQMLQQEINEANGEYAQAFADYVTNTQNSTLCLAYSQSLDKRISANQAMVQAGCLSGFLLENTQETIEQDQEEKAGLDCN